MDHQSGSGQKTRPTADINSLPKLDVIVHKSLWNLGNAINYISVSQRNICQKDAEVLKQQTLWKWIFVSFIWGASVPDRKPTSWNQLRKVSRFQAFTAQQHRHLPAFFLSFYNLGAEVSFLLEASDIVVTSVISYCYSSPYAATSSSSSVGSRTDGTRSNI